MNTHNALILVFFLISFSTNLVAREKVYYIDQSGDPIHSLNHVAKHLEKIYGELTIWPVNVKYWDGPTSRFNCEGSPVALISNSHRENFKLFSRVVAHETSHIALCRLTDGASILNQFRFFDEGYANIVGSKLYGEDILYKGTSLRLGSLYHHYKHVSFSEIQNWETYYGGDNGRDYNAYNVGSTFIYFIMDNYGPNILDNFFSNIGSSKSLKDTSISVFGVSLESLEKSWKQYLAQYPPAKEPKIVTIYPNVGATDVPIDVKEIYVHFDMPMRKLIFLGTNCREICYKNAYWKTDKILAIKILKPLRQETNYNISLGYKKWFYLLKGKNGVPFPRIEWFFTTKI
ncbi:MAG: hypothetical protein ISR65_19260 [Bacteriovoracaceae bacterium]|nr:hypothetical protein [Bacteriovoracaceae bacterium]